jgi:hypothetical protein
MKSRQVLVTCTPCEYKVRASRLQLERGLPKCGVCGRRMKIQDPVHPRYQRTAKENQS